MHWLKRYGHFTEGVDFAYWWSFSGEGSAINGATPSSLIKTKCVTSLIIFIYYRILTQLDYSEAIIAPC